VSAGRQKGREPDTPDAEVASDGSDRSHATPPEEQHLERVRVKPDRVTRAHREAFDRLAR
jgi:hypothetical protein